MISKGEQNDKGKLGAWREVLSLVKYRYRSSWSIFKDSSGGILSGKFATREHKKWNTHKVFYLAGCDHSLWMNDGDLHNSTALNGLLGLLLF